MHTKFKVAKLASCWCTRMNTHQWQALEALAMQAYVFIVLIGRSSHELFQDPGWRKGRA